ncbi:DUF5131 family protein [Allomesorhizobium alhagi]|uniref:Gp37Gp68 family protein n=1 Tax=Mesorhizobium alhagi CCNWXJ12-2 TaxID=1107882 RepID=H0HQZ9_9HYPH|nr:DUF5131 family protein [Mesorhizobium alhagi]EHK56861.1 Gp37Gp68 family protein [Mesorhizobium alhagi CCNWXJ12-2]
MGDNTAIEWTDATWNPIGGCSIKSAGCAPCYAQQLAGTRLKHHPLYAGTTTLVKGKPVFNGHLTAAPTDHPVWTFPLSWRGAKNPVMGPNARSLIFVGDMSDLFHEERSLGYAMRVFEIGMRSSHILQLLTKRPERMLEFLKLWHDLGTPDEWEPKLASGPEAIRAAHKAGRARLFADMLDTMGDPPPGCAYPFYDWAGGIAGWAGPFNIWFGFSAERQREFDERWPAMREIAAMGYTVFCSYEPAIGALTLPADFLQLGRKAWLIAGGMSGRNADRPPHPAWFRGVRDQCAAAGVPFLFKQWGNFAPAREFALVEGDRPITVLPDGRVREWDPEFPAARLVDPEMVAMLEVGKKAAGRLLDGVEHNGFPEARP